MYVRLAVAISLWLTPFQCSARWLGIPTVPFVPSGAGDSISLHTLESIVVDVAYANSTDTKGETLIPPTLYSFALTFQDDLKSVLGLQIPVLTAPNATKNTIFLTIGNASDYRDAAHRPTSEGYKIDVTAQGITLTGASALGVWWGTRSILQQGVLSDGMKLSLGSAVDSPGWGIRGLMFDVGRHYYPPGFVIEMCSYLSFFKQNTLHLHLSDSMNLNMMLSQERRLTQYSAFRLNSPDPAVKGLNNRPNESYTFDDFEKIQQSCASRGVTIIPEIEAPGHALVITQWKPELALIADFTLLDIANPQTIPTMQTIWSTFLPWFHCKTVHLGADEYHGAVSEYNDYVNVMHDYIGQKFGKAVRIWGTFVPSSNPRDSNVNKNVSVQHWEFFEANPYWQFIKNGYSVINSDDQFYIVNKWSGSYPQTINIDRIFHGAPGGGPTAPNIFDRSNATNNPPRDNPLVLGQMPAIWNDFGPNSTAAIEAYYALREGLPALGDKQWGGDLQMAEFYNVFEKLQTAAPGQNLDGRVHSKSETIFSYDFSDKGNVTDKSGNGYDAALKGACDIDNSTLTLHPGCEVHIPLGAKGKNYTLSFSVNPKSSVPGTLFSGTSSSLRAGNGTSQNVMLITGGNAFPVNYTLPVGTWTDVRLVGIGNATYLTVAPSGSKNETTYEFTATIGFLATTFVWGNPMAIQAPIAAIGGDTFEGMMKNVTLRDGADPEYAKRVAPIIIYVEDYKPHSNYLTRNNDT